MKDIKKKTLKNNKKSNLKDIKKKTYYILCAIPLGNKQDIENENRSTIRGPERFWMTLTYGKNVSR